MGKTFRCRKKKLPQLIRGLWPTGLCSYSFGIRGVPKEPCLAIPAGLGRKNRGSEKCRYGGIGRRTGFRIPRLVRESSSLSTCKYYIIFRGV